MRGTLYITATPIGNMEDITLRAIRVLKEVDVIAAEDTRHTLGLLNHFGIKKPVFSCHEHNERESAEKIVAKLLEGKSIALLSDAGMPTISDPGYLVVEAAIKAEIPVTVLPGANAALCALSMSLLPHERFVFEGFLPSANKERKERLKELRAEKRTMVFYESPHHLKKTLDELYSGLGDRQVTVARELTKVYEEVLQTSLKESCEYFGKVEPRGEFVLVVSGNTETTAVDAKKIRRAVEGLTSGGMSLSNAIKQASEILEIPKNQVYSLFKE